jgi:hypothetical protein
MSHPFHALGELAQEDAEYAWALQCNLAVPIMDEVRCSHEAANRAAARIMYQWFAVDITQHEHWKSFERCWSEGPPSPSDNLSTGPALSDEAEHR